MRITVESAIVQEALRVALRLAPPLTGNVVLESDGKTLKLKSASELARVTVSIPAPVQGQALFAVPTEALRDAVKGRSELEMSFDKSMLAIKSGKYLTKLATVDAIAVDDIEIKDKADTWKLAPEQSKWLKTAVTQVALKSNVSSETFMPVSVKLTDKAAFVSCYDNNHMAFIHSKDVQGNLDVTLPLDTFNAVLDVFDELACTMSVTKSALRMKNKLVDVVLSLPDREGEELIAVDEVIGKAKEALKVKGKEIMVPKTEVQNFLENAKSVATKERSEVSVTVEPQKLTLMVQTTNGSSKVTIKADTKAKAEFKIDYEFLAEAVSKSVEEMQMKLVDGSFLMISGKHGHNVMALNQ